MAGKNSKAGRPREHTDAEIADAIRGSLGILAIAAKRLGITRMGLWKRIAASPHLQEVRDEENERLGDLAESKLVALIEREDPHSIQFALRTRYGRRGWSEKMNVEVDGSVRMVVAEEIVDAPPGQ